MQQLFDALLPPSIANSWMKSVTWFSHKSKDTQEKETWTVKVNIDNQAISEKPHPLSR